jgi:hypothetical protein
MTFKNIFYGVLIAGFGVACKNSSNPEPPVVLAPSFSFNSLTVNGEFDGFNYKNLGPKPVVKFAFSTTIDPSSIQAAVGFNSESGQTVPFSFLAENGDSAIVIQPVGTLEYLNRYTISISKNLKSKEKGALLREISVDLTTGLDSSDKFPRISDDALLTLVQKQTFKYFWDFAHPVSGLARERNTSGDVVTSGGSGFGIMTIPVGIERKFITREQGVMRMQKIVGFLKTKAQTFHGAFPHWLNGATGEVVPFSAKDNGADLVETSFLMQGLLTARQYFNKTDDAETSLRNDINSLWRAVEWDWFTRGQNVLYWHWSPSYNWDMNLPIRGWNESLITYVLAASSPTHPISKAVYDNGWTGNGAFVNGKTYYGYPLPLGEPSGGPLFFSHYSFLGINPASFRDAYTDYLTQVRNHTLINYNYCKTNPQGYAGYSEQCWGLTACDVPNGYNANSPVNDQGVIAPTAALSSLPYTTDESMQALRFFYYKLGDRLWGEYGFYDAFSIEKRWFATSTLAIDQGPIVIMIENHRSALLWKLFSSCPEVHSGLKNLGFSDLKLN